MAKIVDRGTLTELKRGAVLLEEDTPHGLVCFVSSGLLGVWERDFISNELRLVFPAWRSSVLIKSPALSGLPNGRITAMAPSNVYCLSDSQLLDLWEDHGFLQGLMALQMRNFKLEAVYEAAMRSDSFTERVVNFACASFLHTHAEWPKGSFSIDWPLRRSDFASLMGASRSHHHAVLHQLEQDGKLKISGRMLTCRLKALDRGNQA